MEANPGITNKNMLICPSVSVDWTPEQIWNTGFLDAYSDYITALAVERQVDFNSVSYSTAYTLPLAIPTTTVQPNTTQTLPSLILNRFSQTTQPTLR